MEATKMTNEFALPPALEKGDKVAVLATSSGVQNFPEVIDIGVDRLEERFGLDVVVFDNARRDTEYLYNHQEEKAEDLMRAFEDPEIKGVVAVTGGDEQIRMLKHLQPERLKENPTRFYGISDNTCLHTYLYNLGIQSFYGGQILDDLLAEGEIGEYIYSYLEKAFFEDELGKLESSQNFTDEYFDLFQDEITDDREAFKSPDWEYWNFDGQNVEGRLFGGCFSVIKDLLMADKLPNEEKLEGSILALETSEENPSTIEVKRWLINMGETGFLQKFSAILVARPMREPLHGEKTLGEKEEYHEKQIQTIKDQIKRYCPDTPVVFNMDFGHTHPKIPLNLGAKIKIDPGKEEINSQ